VSYPHPHSTAAAVIPDPNLTLSARFTQVAHDFQLAFILHVNTRTLRNMSLFRDDASLTARLYHNNASPNVYAVSGSEGIYAFFEDLYDNQRLSLAAQTDASWTPHYQPSAPEQGMLLVQSRGTLYRGPQPAGNFLAQFLLQPTGGNNWIVAASELDVQLSA
jgi:hypothetical protein